MTHLNFILAAYSVALISLSILTLRTWAAHKKTSQQLKMLMKQDHES